MAPQRSLLQGAFLLPFLVSSISAFPYNTNSDANSKARDLNLNLLKPRSHFPTLFKRQNTTFTPANTNPSSNPGTRLGCYRDDSASSRLLPTSFTASDTLTLEACAVFCSSSPYFGVEYGRECWCASSSSGFSPTSPSTLAAKVSDTDCSFPCAGNNDQTCGAGERIEVYTNALYRPPMNAQVPGFDYLGCYRESSPRLLPNSLLGDDTLTTAKCAAYCTNLSFPYFGLEYGRECWCGVSPPFDSQKVPETECSMTCAGAPDQIGKVTYDAAMTLDKCRMTCEKDGYPYFGTEYGSQCFCGTKLYDGPENDDVSDDEDDYPPRALKVLDRECSMRCGGDATNMTNCGDANRLSVYWLVLFRVPQG